MARSPLWPFAVSIGILNESTESSERKPASHATTLTPPEVAAAKTAAAAAADHGAGPSELQELKPPRAVRMAATARRKVPLMWPPRISASTNLTTTRIAQGLREVRPRWEAGPRLSGPCLCGLSLDRVCLSF